MISVFDWPVYDIVYEKTHEPSYTFGKYLKFVSYQLDSNDTLFAYRLYFHCIHEYERNQTRHHFGILMWVNFELRF